MLRCFANISLYEITRSWTYNQILVIFGQNLNAHKWYCASWSCSEWNEATSTRCLDWHRAKIKMSSFSYFFHHHHWSARSEWVTYIYLLPCSPGAPAKYMIQNKREEGGGGGGGLHPDSLSICSSTVTVKKKIHWSRQEGEGASRFSLHTRWHTGNTFTSTPSGLDLTKGIVQTGRKMLFLSIESSRAFMNLQSYHPEFSCCCRVIIPSFHEFAQQPISGFWVTGNNSSLDSSSSSCTGGWQSRLQAL